MLMALLTVPGGDSNPLGTPKPCMGCGVVYRQAATPPPKNPITLIT
jgi:hypothetical protein